VKTALAHNTALGWPRRTRGHLAFSFAAVAYVLMAVPAMCAELIMYEEPGCMWCRQWHAEIGPGYAKTTEGLRAPLRQRMLADPPLAGLTLSTPVRLTPTFVLADNGREVGRIVGYPGSDFFYPLLNDLLKRLPVVNAAPMTNEATPKTMNQ